MTYLPEAIVYPDHEACWDTIQSAIDWVYFNCQGGVVAVKEGTYTLNRHLILRPNISLIGSGRKSTIITLDDNVDDNIIRAVLNSSGEKSLIQSLQLDGNKDNQASGHGVWNQAEDLTINDCLIKNTKDNGVYLENRTKILNSGIEDTEDTPVYGYYDGAKSYTPSGSMIVGNYIYKSPNNYGIRFDNAGSQGDVEDILVINNDVRDAMDSYIYLNNIKNAILRGNINSLLLSDYLSDLLGYWKFDEGIGSTAYDSSGNENNGAINGTGSWTDGIMGLALNFNGVDNYVTVPYEDFDDLSVATIMFLAKLDNISITHSFLFIGDSDGSPNNEFGIHFYYGTLTAERRKIRVFKWINGTRYDRWGSTKILDNNWHHIAVVIAGVSSRPDIYIDGVEVASYSNGGYPWTTGCTSNISNIDGASIGINFRGGGGLIDGLIDDYRIYNRALSADEIATYYNYISGTAYKVTNCDRILLSDAISDDVTTNLNNSGNTNSYYRDWLEKSGAMVNGNL